MSSIAMKDVNFILANLRDRARYIYKRTNGLMKTSRALVHHFNAACRASRQFPGLLTSRLLMSLNDFDLPVTHRKPTVTLLHQMSELLFLIVLVSLATLTVLPEAIQESIIEVIVTLGVNFSLLIALIVYEDGIGLYLYITVGVFVFLIFLEYLNLRRRTRVMVQVDTKDHFEHDDNIYDSHVNDVIKTKLHGKFNSQVDFRDFLNKLPESQNTEGECISEAQKSAGFSTTGNELFATVEKKYNNLAGVVVSKDQYLKLVSKKIKPEKRVKRQRQFRQDVSSTKSNKKIAADVNSSDELFENFASIHDQMDPSVVKLLEIEMTSRLASGNVVSMAATTSSCTAEFASKSVPVSDGNKLDNPGVVDLTMHTNRLRNRRCNKQKSEAALTEKGPGTNVSGPSSGFQLGSNDINAYSSFEYDSFPITELFENPVKR